MKPRHIAVLALVASRLAVTARSATPQAEPIVNRIDVEGNHRVSEQSIREHVASRVGQPLDPETVDSDLRAVYNTGEFRTVTARLDRRGSEEILVITVHEKRLASWE